MSMFGFKSTGRHILRPVAGLSLFGLAACGTPLPPGQPVYTNPIIDSQTGEQRGEIIPGRNGLGDVENIYGLSDGRTSAAFQGETWDQQFYRVAAPIAAFAGAAVEAGFSSGGTTLINNVGGATLNARLSSSSSSSSRSSSIASQSQNQGQSQRQGQEQGQGQQQYQPQPQRPNNYDNNNGQWGGNQGGGQDCGCQMN